MGFLVNMVKNLGFWKAQEISWIAMLLLSSQEGSFSMIISLQFVMVICRSLNAHLTNFNVFQVVHVGHKPSHKARGLVVQWWVLGQKIFRHSWYFLNISPALVTSGIAIIRGLWNSVKYSPLWTGKNFSIVNPLLLMYFCIMCWKNYKVWLTESL